MEPLIRLIFQASLLVAILDVVNSKNDSVKVAYTHPLRNSSLMCYRCFNGDRTNDCVKMSNTSKIPVLYCKQEEKFCKVRRLHTNGELTTFDRYCASQCAPGCAQGAIYEECISCCTTSLCNTDNGSDSSRRQTVASFVWIVVHIWLKLCSG